MHWGPQDGTDYFRPCPESRSPDSLEDKQELQPKLVRERKEKPTAALCVLDAVQEIKTSRRSEVCLQFSLSHSEDGAIHPGAVSQLHRCPNYSYSYMASREVLSVLRCHSSWNWLQCSRAVFCMAFNPIAVMGCLFLAPHSTSDLHAQYSKCLQCQDRLCDL